MSAVQIVSHGFWFRKKLFFSLLFLVFLGNFSCISPAFSASSIELASSQNSAQKAAVDLRISYASNVGTANGKNTSEEYLNELFQILKRYGNFNLTLVPTSEKLSSAFAAIQANESNMVGFFAKSPERMFRYKFGKYPIATSQLYLATDATKDINYNDTQAMNGKTVAIFVENSAAKNALDAFIEKNNIQMQYIIYDTYHEYMTSDADYILVNGFYLMEDKQVAAEVGKQEMYFATTPAHQPLLNALDAAMEQAERYDAVALKKLFLKHVNKSTFSLRHTLSPEEIHIMENPRKVAEVGFAEALRPIQYVNEQGEPAGISIGVLRLLQKMHTNPTRLVPYDPASTEDIRHLDMTFSVVGHREMKEKYFYTSSVYAQIPLVFFMRKEVLTPGGQRSFGMMNVTTMNLNEVQKRFPQWDMQAFESVSEAVGAFEKGTIDALLLTENAAEILIARFGVQDNVVTPTSLSMPLQFYLNKKYPIEALNVLNAFLEKLDPLAVQKVILEEKNAVRAPSTLGGMLHEHVEKILPIAFVLGVLLVAVYWMRVKAEKRKLQAIIDTDALTGLATKDHILRIMQRTLAQAKPGEYMLASIDIDKFSLLNQVYGQDKGNEVLRLGASLLQKKYSGKYKAECIARIRDDVFLVFMKTDFANNSPETPEYVLDGTDGVKEILRSNYTISISRGYYIIDDLSVCPETIIDYANTARLGGKSVHGISTTLFTDEMKQALTAQKRVIYNMEQAIAHNEFVLNFQPKVNLKNGKMSGAEVLVRWHPSDGPPIYPDDFISVFESNAFIAKLDMYVFEKTCQFIHDHRQVCSLPPLAMNLSGISILHDETYSTMRRHMQLYAIEPHEIEIEITESALVAESEAFMQAITELDTLGCKIAIDDFGTGVSSLHRLSSLRVDVVKLDKAFLDEKLTQRKGILLVASLISMLHRLEIQVVAEGVENAKHVAILKKMHCDVAQGYYFSRPLAQDVFVQKMIMARPAPHNYVNMDGSAPQLKS